MASAQIYHCDFWHKSIVSLLNNRACKIAWKHVPVTYYLVTIDSVHKHEYSCGSDCIINWLADSRLHMHRHEYSHGSGCIINLLVDGRLHIMHKHEYSHGSSYIINWLNKHEYWRGSGCIINLLVGGRLHMHKHECSCCSMCRIHLHGHAAEVPMDTSVQRHCIDCKDTSG